MKRYALLFAAIAASFALAFSTPASAAQSHHQARFSADAASGWEQVWIIAYSAHGCMDENADVRLSPVISWPCDAFSNWWWGRILNYNNNQYDWGTPGAHLEFVDQTKTYALGFSGGEFKMETPNDSSTYLVVAGTAGNTAITGFWDSSEQHAPAPNGKGLPLKVVSPIVLPAQGWVVCLIPNGCL